MVVNETFCGTKNDLETPSTESPGPTTVGRDPETGTTTDVGILNPTDTTPSLVTGGDIFPPGTPWSETPSGSLPGFDPKDTTSVTIADVDGDGDEDIVVTTIGGEATEIYINPGNGDFTGVQPVKIGPPGEETPTPASSDVTVVDVNGDGAPDIVLANTDGPNEIYLGKPGSPGTFEDSPLEFGAPDDVTKDVEVVDVDGDGALDIVVANDGQQNKIYYGDITLVPGNAPTYGTNPDQESNFGSANSPSTSVELADLNGDGRLDFVIGNDGHNDEVLLGGGTPTTRPVITEEVPTALHYTGTATTNDIVISDVTGDGILDIVLALENGETVVFPGDAVANYAASLPIIISGQDPAPPPLAGARSVDLSTGPGGSSEIVIGLSDGSAETFTYPIAVGAIGAIRDGTKTGSWPGKPTFTEPPGGGDVDLPEGLDVTSVSPALGDLDGDGDNDLILGLADGTFIAIANVGTPMDPDFEATTEADWNPVDGLDVGENATPLLVDLDGDGDLELVSGNADGDLKEFENDIGDNPTTGGGFYPVSGPTNPNVAGQRWSLHLDLDVETAKTYGRDAIANAAVAWLTEIVNNADVSIVFAGIAKIEAADLPGGDTANRLDRDAKIALTNSIVNAGGYRRGLTAASHITPPRRMQQGEPAVKLSVDVTSTAITVPEKVAARTGVDEKAAGVACRLHFSDGADPITRQDLMGGSPIAAAVISSAGISIEGNDADPDSTQTRGCPSPPPSVPPTPPPPSPPPPSPPSAPPSFPPIAAGDDALSGNEDEEAQFPWWLPLIIIGILLLCCCCCWLLFTRWRDNNKDNRDKFFFSRRFTVVKTKEEVEVRDITLSVDRTHIDPDEIAQESSTQNESIEDGGGAGISPREGAFLRLDVIQENTSGAGTSGGGERDSEGETLELPQHGHPSRLFRARKGNKDKLKKKAVIGAGGEDGSKPSRDMEHGKMPQQHRYTSVYQTQGQL